METFSILLLFILIVVVIGVYTYQMNSIWPIVRGRVHATWPMYPGNTTEGFETRGNYTLSQWLPSPEVLTKPTVGDCPGTLHNAAEYNSDRKKPYKSYDLLNGGKYEPRVASGPTAERCYKTNWSRELELSGSYAQRTNNYKHNYPDSCSSWNHDLVLDFYEPHPTTGPYQLPKV